MEGLSNHGIRRSALALVFPGAAIPTQAAGVTLAAHSASAARASFAITTPGETIDRFIAYDNGRKSGLACSKSVSAQALSLATPDAARVGKSPGLSVAVNDSANTSGFAARRHLTVSRRPMSGEAIPGTSTSGRSSSERNYE